MRFLFTRHGQTDWNLEGKLQGAQDISLNEKGLEQARLLADKLFDSKAEIRKIYTSTKKRAYETGCVIGEKLNISCEPINGIEEMNFGDWEGLTWKEIEETFPENYEKWQNSRRHTKPQNGESCQDVLDRVLPVLKELAQKEEGTILVVTHGAVLMSLQCYMKEVPFEDMWDYLLDNGDVLEVEGAVWKKYL